MTHRKVFIIGAAGAVGASTAHSLAMQGVVSEVVLIDIAADIAHGQAMDIDHATGYTNGIIVRTGDYHEIAEDDIIVITAGLPRRPDQTRTQLLDVNAQIMRTIVRSVMAQGKPVFILVVANPVDLLTQIALEASGLPKHRVFGTGTTLDTARMRATVARQLGVSPLDIQGYILGEHGNSSFATTSTLSIGGVPLAELPGYEPKMLENLTEDIRLASQKIIEAKKVTNFGISQSIVKIVSAMVSPTGSVLPVCAMTAGEYGLDDIVLGLPALVNSSGAQILDHYPLSHAETELLHRSAATLRTILHEHRELTRSAAKPAPTPTA